MSRNSEIKYARIYPPIGIARVGDSDEIFIGPEWPGQDLSADPLHRYKDAAGHVKRQAARFRIYGFDAQDKVVCELTAADADIIWSATLANHKASWFKFLGAAIAREQFDHPERDPNPDESTWTTRTPFVFRNLQIGRPPDLNQPWDRQLRARMLNIDGGTRTVAGRSTRADPKAVEVERLDFTGRFLDEIPVYLGELRTDGEGRLLVLGGRGKSAGYDVHGRNDPSNWITNYANNDRWHDDTSDGPVSAKVVLKEGSRELEVRGRAWVLVTPPDFAPDTRNLVTQLDVQTETAAPDSAEGPTLPWAPELEELRPDGKTEFWRDIHPFLERLRGYSWVSGLGLRGHGTDKQGDFFSKEKMDVLADPGSDEGGRLRGFIVGRVRQPALNPQDPVALQQATMQFMPPLSGDEGNRVPGSPETWLTVTRTQWAHLKRWLSGDFTVGSRVTLNGEPPTVAHQPAALTRSALERCVGGAFYPGIEITSIVRATTLFQEAFRIDSTRFQAGDISQHMACPWQADFYECNTSWWPAQRPDSAVHADTLHIIEKEFERERDDGSLPKMLFERQDWDRGIATERPPMPEIIASLVPDVAEGQDLAAYRDAVVQRLAQGYDDNVAYDDCFLYSGDVVKPLNPWRVQYLNQERLDRFSGRYFHLRFPSPEEYLSTKVAAGASQGLGQIDEALRAGWPLVPKPLPPDAQALIDDYVAFAVERRDEKLRALVQGLADTSNARDAASLQKVLAGIVKNGSDTAPWSVYGEVDQGGESQLQQAFFEMLVALSDSIYLGGIGTSGDMGMVKRWSTRGFVVRREIRRPKGLPPVVVHAETETHPSDGLFQAEYFYRLMNVSEFPEMYEYSRHLVQKVLDETQTFIDADGGLAGDDLLEHAFTFTPDAFAARLEEIYEYYRARASVTQGWQNARTRAEIIKYRLLANGPFNQLDGGWLRFAADTGPIDEIHALLFNIWSDEIGNGDVSLHHGNLYTALLRSNGVYLPDLQSREYAQSPLLRDEWFSMPVFELAISLHSKEFFAEILGMTLFLEWEVLDLATGVKTLDFMGFDTQFWRMHIGIDNATEGHGHQARRAVELHLENARLEGGEQAVQAEWKRIWRGFIAFATAGMNYMPNDGDIAERRGKTVTDRLSELITRKAPFAALNHGDKRLASNFIGDLFDEPQYLLQHLSASQWIVRGKPDDSRLLSYLTTYSGPMYKVFDKADLALWSEWISWLGREGETGASTAYLNREQSMVALLKQLSSSASGPSGHARHWLRPHGGGGPRPLLDWFADVAARRVEPRELLLALREESQGYIAPYRPDQSSLVVEHLRVDRPMGQALDRRFFALSNQIGRLIIREWILAGCPVDGKPVVALMKQKLRPAPQVRSIVEKYGMGSVH